MVTNFTCPYSSPSYQDSSLPANQNLKGFSSSQSSNNFVEDSNEWVWSNAATSNDRGESKTISSDSSLRKSRNSSDNGDNLLIDFGEKKTKKQNSANAAVKTRTAEEEAWDMLNS